MRLSANDEAFCNYEQTVEADDCLGYDQYNSPKSCKIDDGYKKAKLIHGRPSNRVQTLLNNFSPGRKFALIKPDRNGGIFDLSSSVELLVWIPYGAFNGETALFFVKSVNVQDYPLLFGSMDGLLSDVYHFYPNGQTFRHRVLVRIPVKPFTGGFEENCLVLCSDTDHVTPPNWRVITKTAKSEDGSEPWYFYHKGFCYLMLKHFCVYCVVKRPGVDNIVTRTGPGDIREFPLMMTMFGLFKPQSGVLQVTVMCQIDSHKPPLPHVSKTDHHTCNLALMG